MASGFRLLGPAHFTIMAAIPSVAALLAWATRGDRTLSRRVAALMGGGLAGNEIVWYVWSIRVGGFRFPDGLPLQLCDLTLWLTVIAALTLWAAAFEFAWLAGLAGAAMAVITPDLWAPPLSYPTIYFFLSHGGEMAILLFLVWSRLARPRPGCVRRSLLLLNAYAALLGAFNAVFHTNYMYLCRKPASESLLNLFGPWPVYLIPAEVTAALLFWLLWLPFRKRNGA